MQYARRTFSKVYHVIVVKGVLGLLKLSYNTTCACRFFGQGKDMRTVTKVFLLYLFEMMY